MPTYITTRNMTYDTRRLKAGDEFRTNARDGDLLVRLGRAKVVPESLAQQSKPVADPLVIARADYEAALGKRAFHGWDEAELRRKIAEHQAASVVPETLPAVPPTPPVMPPVPVVPDES